MELELYLHETNDSTYPVESRNVLCKVKIDTEKRTCSILTDDNYFSEFAYSNYSYEEDAEGKAHLAVENEPFSYLFCPYPFDLIEEATA